MIIALTVNSVDRTEDILVDSILKNDIINQEKDSLKFRVLKYADEGFTPEINQEVELQIDAEVEFAGVIVEVKKSIQSSQIVQYDVVCLDYTYTLDRKLVLERYDDKTVAYIIDDILTTYATGFTDTNVNCATEIKTMSFNRLTVSACIDKLAKTVGYSWYVDYDKDIHFFPKNQNAAPFTITDINGNYIQNTLSVKDDLSQLRNTIIIRGSEERASERTEEYVADGTQVQFNLANKYPEMPVVVVNGSTSSVGIDFLTAEDDADCFWSYAEKYVRFKATTMPASTEVVAITGEPLFPIIVKVLDGASVAEYGTYEFFKEDKSIKSREEAINYAQAQLTAYKDGVVEGGFTTDQSGLKSGQILLINSTLLGVNETFLIQSVEFRVVAEDKGEWRVSLATMRTMGILQVLQDLIAFREIREFDPDNLLELIQSSDEMSATDALLASTSWVITSSPYYWWPVSGDGAETPEMKWNFFKWSDVA